MPRQPEPLQGVGGVRDVRGRFVLHSPLGGFGRPNGGSILPLPVKGGSLRGYHLLTRSLYKGELDCTFMAC